MERTSSHEQTIRQSQKFIFCLLNTQTHRNISEYKLKFTQTWQPHNIMRIYSLYFANKLSMLEFVRSMPFIRLCVLLFLK